MSETKKLIFIADDDEDILQIVEMILRANNYDVFTTTNANEIFDHLDRKPSLIFLDIWMSGIDGTDICKRLKATPSAKDIPILLISANAGIEAMTGLCNADGFVSKPFDMQFLLEKIAYHTTKNAGDLTP